MHSLLQTPEWANFKVSQGWLSHEINGVFVLEKKLPFRKSFLYAPEVDFKKIENFEEFLKNLPKNKNLFFRLELLDEFDTEIGQKIVKVLQKFGFIKSFEEVQPEWRQIVDISKSEEEILAQIKPKGRYNIKIAKREGVVVKKSENIDDFYKIFGITAKRDGFSIRLREYFEKLLQILGKKIELLTAEFQGKKIAAEIVSYYNGIASYLYGASSNEYRNMMAPYLLHWEAIKRGKQKGCKYYDLLAVTPEGASESHKYAGITRFKEQFGGRKVHLVGSYDLIYKPFWYKLFKMAEKRRR